MRKNATISTVKSWRNKRKRVTLAMEFTWNQKLYDEIISCTEPLAKRPEQKNYDITAARYDDLVTVEEEEYFTHPLGPYQGTKQELKKDKAYTSQKLIRHTRQVPFSGRAIQQAIDDAAEAGGGTVVIPEGIFYTGALELKSNVELHLAYGAQLCFMRNKTNHYYPVRFSRWEGVECMNFSPFIYANGAENIAVTGTGTLDGCADEFNWMPWKFGYFGETDQEEQRQRLFRMSAGNKEPETRVFDDTVSTLRPPFLQFYRCKNVLVQDVEIANSPFWEINPVLCENVLIKGVHVETNLYNNDGVVPESSKNLLIEDCYFQTGDDCIAIKSGRNDDGRRIGVPCENLVIRNNTFSNGHGGITIGSEISGGVKNVFAEHNSFDSPNLDYPVRFKTNAQRGGRLENIYVRDSVVNKSRLAVVHCDFFYEEGEHGPYMPLLRNVTVDGFQTQPGGAIDAEHAFYLRGFKQAPIENVTFRNMELNGVRGEAVLENIQHLCFENVTINGIRQKDETVDIGEQAAAEEAV